MKRSEKKNNNNNKIIRNKNYKVVEIWSRKYEPYFGVNQYFHKDCIQLICDFAELLPFRFYSCLEKENCQYIFEDELTNEITNHHTNINININIDIDTIKTKSQQQQQQQQVIAICRIRKYNSLESLGGWEFFLFGPQLFAKEKWNVKFCFQVEQNIGFFSIVLLPKIFLELKKLKLDSWYGGCIHCIDENYYMNKYPKFRESKDVVRDIPNEEKGRVCYDNSFFPDPITGQGGWGHHSGGWLKSNDIFELHVHMTPSLKYVFIRNITNPHIFSEGNQYTSFNPTLPHEKGFLFNDLPDSIQLAFLAHGGHFTQLKFLSIDFL